MVLAGNIWSISGWVEARGVCDDICYLRQGHLFERFALGRLDTNMVKDADHYLAVKLKEIGFLEWNEVSRRDPADDRSDHGELFGGADHDGVRDGWLFLIAKLFMDGAHGPGSR